MRHAQLAVILLPALVVSAAVLMPSPASVLACIIPDVVESVSVRA